MRHGNNGCGCDNTNTVMCACGDGSVAGRGIGAPTSAHYVRGCDWECDAGFQRDATGNACEPAPSPPPSLPPASPPLAPTYLLVYPNQDDCSGQYSLNVTLDHESHNGCSNCWDRCAAGISGASYRIVGPGQVAIAWNSIGAYSYASAGFDRGGYARTQDSGCLKSQGGGAFNLCHSASFTGANAADHENALSAVCSP